MFPKGSISFSFDPRREEVEPTKVGKETEGCRVWVWGPWGDWAN